MDLFEFNGISGFVPGIEVARFGAGYRALTQFTKLETDLETKSVTAYQPVYGAMDGGSSWLTHTYDDGSGRYTKTYEPKSGHTDTVLLGPNTGAPDVYSDENTLADAAGFCDELLAAHDLDGDDWGDGFQAEYTWGGAAPEITESGTGPAARSGFTSGGLLATKTKIAYRLASTITGFPSNMGDVSSWQVRHVTRSGVDYKVFEADEEFERLPDPDESDDDTLYSVGTAVSEPPDANTVVAIEGEAAGATVTFIEDGEWPLATCMKGGFVAYLQDGAPKIYRTETASGSFAGNGDDPARSYSGAQEFTSDALSEPNRIDYAYYDLTFSEDVPWRYARGPLPDQSFRFGDTSRTGFSETGRTETTRSFRRTVFSGGGAPIHDDITFTLSDEITASALRAIADGIAADSPSEDEHALFGALVAAKWLSSDETCYMRKRSDTFVRATIDATYPGDLALGISWDEITVTESGESASAQTDSITINTGDLTADSAPVAYEGTEGARTYLKNLICDSVPELPQPIWLRRA